MAKPEWGTKRTCHNCGARFYDLCREPIVCPVCSTVYDLEQQPRVRRGGAVSKDEAASRPKIAKAAVAGAAAEGGMDEDHVAVDMDNEEVSEAVDDEDDDDNDDNDDTLEDLNSEGQDLIEDTSDLGEDGDDIGEVMEHIDEDVEDKS